MKKKHRLALLLLLGAALVASLVPGILYEELLETSMAKIWPEETVFAPGYSWRAWNMIRVGDSQAKVLSVLGEPLRRTQASAGRESFLYSQQGPHDTNFRVRLIMFDQSGRVIKKKAEYYLD